MTPISPKTMPNLCNRRQPLHYATALNLLIKAGIDLATVHILPVGEYKNYRGEIHGQKPAPGARLGPGTQIELEVGVPAAIDQLPYQFFYGLHGRFSRGSDWEDRARRLLAPFDSPAVRYQARSLRQTLKFNFAMPDRKQIDRFLGLFDFALEPDCGPAEALVWATLLPAFHRWAGNPDGVAKILEHLFGFKFEIIENITSEFEIPESIQYRLGEKTGRLGRETILGRSFVESDSTYQVLISGLGPADITSFLPGRPHRRKLEWILSNCMPGHLEYSISFRMDTSTDPAIKVGENICLGYTSYL